MELIVHLAQRTMITSVLTTTLESLVVSTLVGPINLVMDGAVFLVIVAVLSPIAFVVACQGRASGGGERQDCGRQ